MTGVTLPASTSSLRTSRSALFVRLDGRLALLTHEHGHDRDPDHAAELAAGVSPPLESSVPVGVSARLVSDMEWSPTLSRMRS